MCRRPANVQGTFNLLYYILNYRKRWKPFHAQHFHSGPWQQFGCKLSWSSRWTAVSSLCASALMNGTLQAGNPPLRSNIGLSCISTDFTLGGRKVCKTAKRLTRTHMHTSREIIEGLQGSVQVWKQLNRENFNPNVPPWALLIYCCLLSLTSFSFLIYYLTTPYHARIVM